MVGVLSLAPCYVEKRQVRGVDHTPYPSQLHGASCSDPVAPCTRLKRERTEGRKREVLHLFRCYTHTHTHPAGAGSTLKGKRKKKADTRRADGQKQRRGGEGNKRTSGTNLHGETDLTKTAHTPKPHDTLRRGTQGKLGTKWGTS